MKKEDPRSYVNDLLKSSKRRLGDVIKEPEYNNHLYDGVYAIYNQNGELIRAGKTSGKQMKKENRIADRLWCNVQSRSRLRIDMGMTKAEAENGSVQILKIDDPLMRGRVELILLGEHAPIANHTEIKK